MTSPQRRKGNAPNGFVARPGYNREFRMVAVPEIRCPQRVAHAEHYWSDKDGDMYYGHLACPGRKHKARWWSR